MQSSLTCIQSLLTVYQIIGTASSFPLDLTHFLHVLEQRGATQFAVHRVEHGLDRVHNAQIRQTVIEKSVHSLFIGRVQHGGMLLRSGKAMPGKGDRGERLIVQRLEGPLRGFGPVACRGDIAQTVRRGQTERDRQTHVGRRCLAEYRTDGLPR